MITKLIRIIENGMSLFKQSKVIKVQFGNFLGLELEITESNFKMRKNKHII